MRALSSFSRPPVLCPAALLSLTAIATPLFHAVFPSHQPLRSEIHPQRRQSRFRRFSAKTSSLQNPLLSSPGWTNTLRANGPYSPSRAVSRVYSMAATDVAPSIVVYVTVPDKETGTKLSHSIIENKLAACVNQIPGVESTYWWQGKVETDSEVLLIIKTRQSLLSELTAHVQANHPYDTPEVIALPITGGSDKYLKWIEDSTQKPQVAQE